MYLGKKRNLIGQLLLFAATVAWGSSFVILKTTIEEVPPFFVIGIRFIIAGILFLLFFIKRIAKMSKSTLLSGILVGLTLAFAYGTQTYGLMYTTPARNAFITALYCVMTPFLLWLFFKTKPKSYHVIAVMLCIVGLALVSLFGKEEQGENVFLGDVFTFLSAIFYALQIVCLVKTERSQQDPICILTIQLLTVGVLIMGLSFCVELPTYGTKMFELTSEQFWKIIYLTMSCTVFAQFALIYGQRMVLSSNQAAIILSLEAVFGAFFSLVFGYESLTLFKGLGFGVIFIAMLISELRLDVFQAVKKIFVKNSSNTK